MDQKHLSQDPLVYLHIKFRHKADALKRKHRDYFKNCSVTINSDRKDGDNHRVV